MIRVEPPSSMSRDTEAAPQCLEKITCDEEETRSFETALRWTKQEMKELAVPSSDPEAMPMLRTGVFHGNPSRFPVPFLAKS